MCRLRSEWGGRAGRSSRQGEMWAGPEQARPPGLRLRGRMSRKGVICPGLVLSAGGQTCRAQDPCRRGSEPNSPWAAKGSSPLPRSLWAPPRLTVEARARQRVPVGPHAPLCEPKDGHLLTDGGSVSNLPGTAADGGRPPGPASAPPLLRAGGYGACARSALRAPSRWLYLSAQQCSEPGQVEGPAAIRARLCPQSELTACRCRVCCGQGPSWGTPATCWTALCAWPTPSAGPGVRVERRPSPPSKPSPPSPHSQRLSGRLCPQPWLHPNFPQL